MNAFSDALHPVIFSEEAKSSMTCSITSKYSISVAGSSRNLQQTAFQARPGPPVPRPAEFQSREAGLAICYKVLPCTGQCTLHCQCG